MYIQFCFNFTVTTILNVSGKILMTCTNAQRAWFREVQFVYFKTLFHDHNPPFLFQYHTSNQECWNATAQPESNWRHGLYWLGICANFVTREVLLHSSIEGENVCAFPRNPLFILILGRLDFVCYKFKASCRPGNLKSPAQSQPFSTEWVFALAQRTLCQPLTIAN